MKIVYVEEHPGIRHDESNSRRKRKGRRCRKNGKGERHRERKGQWGGERQANGGPCALCSGEKKNALPLKKKKKGGLLGFRGRNPFDTAQGNL